MARKKSGEKELYWQDVINRQSESELSIRQFCAEEGVSEFSFYTWRRRLRGGERRASGQSNGRTSKTGGREFIPLKLLGDASVLEVIHPLGYRVRVTGEVNGTALKQILEILDKRSNG